MTKYHDYIPKNDAQLAVFARRLYDYAMIHASRWGVPSPEELVKEYLVVFEKAMEAFSDANHGKVDTSNKNNAKTALVRQLRMYIQGLIVRNTKVTDEDKGQMGLPLRDTKPTVQPVPSVRPYVTAVSIGLGGHKIIAMNSDTAGKRKPAFVTSVAFACRKRRSDEPVSRSNDMPSDTQTNVEKIFMYTESDYGMVVDYAAAYVNSTGKKGPWSEVASLVIAK
jgi:hypothetical protein